MNGKSGSRNENKIALTPAGGGLKSERARANPIDIDESSIMTIKVHTTSICYICLPLVLVGFYFFRSKITYKEKNDSSHDSSHPGKM